MHYPMCNITAKFNEFTCPQLIKVFHSNEIHSRNYTSNYVVFDFNDKSLNLAGSRYPHNSTFEVTKADTDESDLVVDGSSTPSSAIDVTIPGELEGSSYLHVSFKHISG